MTALDRLHCIGELRFGGHRIPSSTGVQQRDPLGPLLFSLSLYKLLEGFSCNCHWLWYLNDGTIIGNQAEVAKFYNYILTKGTQFGLYLNPKKGEVYWPSGGQSFPGFPPIISFASWKARYPLWGSDQLITNQVAKTVDNVKDLHSLLPSLDDPQVELHTLQSCLNTCTCKINRLLWIVPFEEINQEFAIFDVSMHESSLKALFLMALFLMRPCHKPCYLLVWVGWALERFQPLLNQLPQSQTS